MRVLRSRILVAMGLGAQTMLVASCGETSGDGKDVGPTSMTGTSATGGPTTGGPSTTGSTNASASSEASSATSAGGASTDTGASSEGSSATSAGGVGTGGGDGGSAGSAGSGAGGSSDQFCQPWPSCATVRRPFLVGKDLRSAQGAERDDWSTPLAKVELPHARTQQFLAEVWLKDALEEHASVAAFARFTMLLLSVGAPPDLIAASQRASLDEVKHARDCFALAKRYGSSAAGPDTLDVRGAVLPLSLAQLVDLAVEEGCVGETLGALLAKEQRALATDTEVARVLARLERDEARHAELAWKFLAWAIQRGGQDVRDAAERAFTRSAQAIAAMPVVDYHVDLELWHAHGRVTCAEARALSQRALREVVAPCWRALQDHVRSDSPASSPMLHSS